MYRRQSSAVRVKLSILKPTQNRTNIMFYTAELKIRAERTVGELLAEMEKNKGELKRGEFKQSPRSHDATTVNTLKDIGINKSQSSRWQQLAAIPEDDLKIFHAIKTGT
jgi:hypothetical protein